MGTYKLKSHTGQVEYVMAATFAQAQLAAHQIFKDNTYVDISVATQEEVDALINSHSYPVEGE